MKIFNRNFKSEEGNVLFLILIAVALFAALSYAVTQSTRSGGGGADESTSLVQSSQITQYPSSVKTSALRLQISKGIGSRNLAFNPPSVFGSLTRDEIGVFHPDGGGATYQKAVSLGGNQIGPWRFVDVNIQNIGNNSKDDIVAALAELPDSVCDSINSELGLTEVTDTAGGNNDGITTGGDLDGGLNSSFDTLADNIADTDSANGITDSGPNERSPLLASSEGLGDNANTPELEGQAFGCLITNSGTNVYYHVLVER